MIKNAMSLKGKINNLAKKDKTLPQAVMQTYMLERLLERISISEYKDNFILKGGMLISSIIGIDNRSTMDIQAYFDEMPIDLKIDVTAGDKITYKEINYKYNLLLEKRSIEIWTYNVETIIAEKYESIIKRSILNTRIRDFYDLYMLTHFDKKNIQNKVLAIAIKETAKHRETFDIINDRNIVEDVINSIQNDKSLKEQWNKYQSSYEYAKDIKYEQLIDSIIAIKEIYFK